MKEPLISVVMSVYNGQEGLEDSIKSILNQTYNNFEFIIINDGSTDGSLKIIEKFKAIDKRILIINHSNKGLAYSLNEGIRRANGEFIARMDADDISLPHRLLEQVKILIENENIMVVGTAAYYKDPITSSKNLIKMPEYHNEIMKIIFKSSPFIHPSVLIRKKFLTLVKGYDDSFKRCQDYDIWLRGRFIGEYYNMQKPLILYTNKKKFILRSVIISAYIRLKNSLNLKDIFKSIFWSMYETIYVLLGYLLKPLKKINN